MYFVVQVEWHYEEMYFVVQVEWSIVFRIYDVGDSRKFIYDQLCILNKTSSWQVLVEIRSVQMDRGEHEI